MRYIHTLAPDPHQLELRLDRPPDKKLTGLPIRASPNLCPYCHTTGHDRAAFIRCRESHTEGAL